jgi:hypothetical protein
MSQGTQHIDGGGTRISSLLLLTDRLTEPGKGKALLVQAMETYGEVEVDLQCNNNFPKSTKQRKVSRCRNGYMRQVTYRTSKSIGRHR